MARDPIVEEVRAIRDEIAKRYNYDVDEIVRALRQRSADRGQKTVSVVPKQPVAPST